MATVIMSLTGDSTEAHCYIFFFFYSEHANKWQCSSYKHYLDLSPLLCHHILGNPWQKNCPYQWSVFCTFQLIYRLSLVFEKLIYKLKCYQPNSWKLIYYNCFLVLTLLIKKNIKRKNWEHFWKYWHEQFVTVMNYICFKLLYKMLKCFLENTCRQSLKAYLSRVKVHVKKTTLFWESWIYPCIQFSH